MCFCLFSLPLTSTCKSSPDLMFVRSRDDNCSPSLLFSLSLSNKVWSKETVLVDDSCNVSSLLYHSPLQLLITNIVSFCFLLIDFASTLTDKLVKLKVFCSFSLSSYSRSHDFAPFVFSYFWEILTHYGFLLLCCIDLSSKTKRINPKRQK